MDALKAVVAEDKQLAVDALCRITQSLTAMRDALDLQNSKNFLKLDVTLAQY